MKHFIGMEPVLTDAGFHISIEDNGIEISAIILRVLLPLRREYVHIILVIRMNTPGFGKILLLKITTFTIMENVRLDVLTPSTIILEIVDITANLLA